MLQEMVSLILQSLEAEIIQIKALWFLFSIWKSSKCTWVANIINNV